MGRQIEHQKIVLVTGKGGVGKTTVATAIATKMAQLGKSTLLVELSDKSTLTRHFDRPFTYKPTSLAENLSISVFMGESCLREFIAYYLRVQTLVNLFFDNKVMKSLVRAAPALRELAILGKVTSGVRGIGPDFVYDVIVVDAYPTGHFQSLLRAPKAMGDIIDVGPMGEQSRGIDATLKDASKTTIVNVTLAEEMPLAESVDFLSDMGRDGYLNLRLVVNKWQEVPRSVQDSGKLTAFSKDGFLEYMGLVSARQDKVEKTFGKKFGEIHKTPFDFDLKLSALDDRMLSPLEDFCKSIL